MVLPWKRSGFQGHSGNERADLLSRFVDKDDWRVNPSVFRLVDAKWGPHTIELN